MVIPHHTGTILGAPSHHHFSWAMGYSQRHCHLCGVAFNMARLRRYDEPEDAAWLYYGAHFAVEEPCAGESGCREGERTAPYDGVGREHLAGPRCGCDAGYSGWRIGVGEMKPMTRVQCIVLKEGDWVPEADDENFEIDSKCFLTGISQNAPNEFNVRSGDFFPTRHGVLDTNISNCAEYAWGIPFHAPCFELYKRVCKERFDEVDIDSLWELRELESDWGNDGWKDIERSPEVLECRSQWWEHKIGTEWLAADPIKIPFLMRKLQDPPKLVLKPKRKDEEASKEAGESKSPQSRNSSDLFTQLSNELLMEIMLHLSSRDVANLRLVSPAFHSLPDFIFKHFIKTDMPWLWEIDELKNISYRDLYVNLKGNWIKQLLGLRNRKRIWADVNKIVDKVQLLREKGESAWPARRWRDGEDTREAPPERRAPRRRLGGRIG